MPQNLTLSGISILKNNTNALSNNAFDSYNGLAVPKHASVAKTSSGSSTTRSKFGWIEGVFIRFYILNSLLIWFFK